MWPTVSFEYGTGEKWEVNFSRSGLLMKVGKREHLNALQNGTLFMKPVGFHIANESKFPGKGIGDAEEGLLTRFENAELLVNGTVVGQAVDGTVYANKQNPIFCCSAVGFCKEGTDKCVFKPDKRMVSDFVNGDPHDYGVILIDRTAFIEQVAKRCKELDIAWLARSVIYSDDSLARVKVENGLLVPPCFFKRTRYAYQSEFRILFSPQVKEKYELNIGSISKISRLFSLDFFENGIEMLIKPR